MHSQENTEQNINDENVIENELTRKTTLLKMSVDARNKTQENEIIVIDKENQITIDANVTIQRLIQRQKTLLKLKKIQYQRR